MKKRLFIILSLLVLSSTAFASGVQRYALFIGSNDGGKNRTRLMYAGSDAQNLQSTMNEIGGVKESNSYLLINPSTQEISRTISSISTKMQKDKDSDGRTEFIFYYSGHSDETGLILGDSRFDYSTLKQMITDVPSDIHVVILDSCYSGNFIRTKGGQKVKPFLFDDSTIVQGHAYLSSSSETEYSQESDEIEASYFTNSLVAGLRGAADLSGDKKVTLNELYSYAFDETLRKTESTSAGPQHPNYNITLVGSGDLILSDFSETDSMISIGNDLNGKIIIRDSNDKMISELTKTGSSPLLLALSQGKYNFTLLAEDGLFSTELQLKKDEITVLSKQDLVKQDKVPARLRGDSSSEENTADYEVSFLTQKPLVWDIPAAFQFNLFIPFTYDSLAQDDYYNKRIDGSEPDDYTVEMDLGLSIFKAGDYTFTLGATIDSAWYRYDTNDIQYEISCSPFLGMYINHFHASSLEGFFLDFYPAYRQLAFTTGQSAYFDYRIAEEIGYNGLVYSNLNMGIYMRAIESFKDYQCDFTFDIGYKIGFNIPDHKSWDAVDSFRTTGTDK